MQQKEFSNSIQNRLKNIDLLSEKSIRLMIKKFPYCEIMHNILLLKTDKNNDISFSETLSKTSIYSSNRKNLFCLVNPQVDISKTKTKKTYNFEEWLNMLNEKKTSSIKTEEKIKKSVQFTESLTTETLAEIYVEQGHYQRAIQAYEILCLKYPKKSSFFANQIKKIKNKLN